MSWKAVELQVAIPRTQEAGRIQDQMTRQNQQFQETLTMHQLKQEEIKRNRTNELDQAEKSVIHDEDDGQQGQNSDHKQSQQKEIKQKQPTVKHPYLGSKIDLNG